MAGRDEHVISVRGLTRDFGEFRAVAGIDFDVERGDVFGFLGANGAGKTTTIRMLCGLLVPSAGSGRILEYDIMKEPERIKPKVGYMSQKFSLYPDLTVEENLDFFGGIYRIHRRKMKDRKRFALAMAGLEGKEGRITGTLSGGWKQRLALGASLLHEPELLFLDEPTAGVSPEARREFWDLIHRLAEKGTTVFVTSHYMDEVEHCDRIVLMSRGRIAALDTPEGLKANALNGNILRLEAQGSLEEVKTALEGLEEVLDVQPFGSAFHILVSKDVDGTLSVSRRLSSRGISVEGVEPVEPSLEDVFISVIGRSER